VLRLGAHDGKCPIQSLDGGDAGGKTFGDALAQYLKIKSPNWADSDRDRNLRRYTFLFEQIPWFTALPLASLTQEHKNKAIAHFPIVAKNHELCGTMILTFHKVRAGKGQRDRAYHRWEILLIVLTQAALLTATPARRGTMCLPR
jgi:hypothetical protein